MNLIKHISNFAVLWGFVAVLGLIPFSAQAYDVEEGFERMTAEEIKEAFTGNTLIGNDDFGEYTIYFPKYKTVRTIYEGKKYKGSWKVKSKKNLYCRKYKGGNNKCFDMYRKGDEVIWYYKDELSDMSTLYQGNPEGINF